MNFKIKYLRFLFTVFLITVAGYGGTNCWAKPDWREIVEKNPNPNLINTVRIYSQSVVYITPKNWNIFKSYRKQNGGHFILETPGPDQTVKQWKDLITVQGFAGSALQKGMTPQKLIKLMEMSISSISPREFYLKEIGEENIKGVDTYMALMGLKKLPPNLPAGLPEGYGEIGLYLALKGKRDMYIVHRSWKGDPYTEDKLLIDEEELQEWIKLLKATRLINDKKREKEQKEKEAKE